MNNDDDKTVVQTEEERRELEKRLLDELSENDTPPDTGTDKRVESADR